MSTSTPGHGASTLKSSEAANARFESKSEDDDSMMSPSTTCGADGGRAGSFAEEIPASKSPKEPNRSSGSRQDLDRPIQRRSSTCSTRARSRSSSNERTRGDGDSLRQEIAQQIGKRDSSSHPSPTSLASSGEKQQRSSGNAVLPGLSGFASEDTVPAGIRERTEVSQHLFVALQQRPGIIDGDWIDKMSAEFNWWSLGMGATKRSHSSLDYRVQNRDDVRNVIVNLLDSLTISLRNCKNLADTPDMESQQLHEAEVVLEERATANVAQDYPSDGDGELDEQMYYIEITLKYLARISAAIRKSGTRFRHQRIDKLLQQRAPNLEDFKAYLIRIILLGSVNTHLLSWVLYRYTETGNLAWKNLWIVLKARFTDPGRLTVVQARLIHANLVRRNRFEVYFSKYSRLMDDKRSKNDKMEEPEYAELAQVSQPNPVAGPSKNVVAISDLPKEESLPASAIDRSVMSSQSATEIGTLVMPERPRTQGTRSVSTKFSQGVMSQDYPKCPTAIGSSLWCPCCAQPLDASYSDPKRDKKWRGHLAEDLSPYVCVYPHCDTPDAMYVTTDDWEKHMKESHSVCRWICDACWFDSDEPTQFQYESEQAWLDHIKTQHEGAFDNDDLPDLAEESQRTALPPVQCPLCHGCTPLLNPETDKHIAEHLHSFSLQALPWEIIGPNQDTQASVGSTVHHVLSLDDGEEATSEVEQRDLSDIGHFSLSEIDSIGTLCFNLIAWIDPQIAKSKEGWLNKLNDALVRLSWVLQRISEKYETYSSDVKGELQTHLVHVRSVLRMRGGDISDMDVKELVMLGQDIAASVAFLSVLGGAGEQSPSPARQSASPTSKQEQQTGSWFLVPYPRNNDFIGRRSILQELQQFLKPSSHARTALVGLGGTGKRQIALEYLYRLKDTCTDMSVFWVQGHNAEQFRQSYTAIALECSIPGYDDPKVQVLPLVKHWLERKDGGPWLMIIDDANDADLFFASHQEPKNASSSAQEKYLGQYIPECAHGSILVISRTKQASQMLAKGIWPIEVKRMGEIEAIQLLRVTLGERDKGAGDDELLTVARRLDCLPHALVQAAAHIERNQVTVGRYLQLLDRGDQELVYLLGTAVGRVIKNTVAPCTVAGAWTLSFRQIQHQNALASELLSLMGFFDQQAIPIEFLEYYSKQQNQEGYRKKQFQESLGILKAFSFVTEEQDHGLDIHKLVQLVLRDWLAKEKKTARFARQALSVVSQAYPVSTYENWVACSKYLPHAYQVLKFNMAESKDEKIQKGALAHNMASYLLHQGQWNDAEKLQLKAVELRIEVLGPDHPDTLSSMNTLASTYQYQGRLEQAAKLGVQVIERSNTRLGLNHPDTLNIMNNLASIYQAQGRWEEAEKLLVLVIERSKARLGADHPIKLNSMNILASICHAQGRWEEAERLGVQVMEAFTAKHGTDHPNTLISMSHLAHTWKRMGKNSAATALMVDCVRLMELKLGANHPRTQSSISSLDEWASRN